MSEEEKDSEPSMRPQKTCDLYTVDTFGPGCFINAIAANPYCVSK